MQFLRSHIYKPAIAGFRLPIALHVSLPSSIDRRIIRLTKFTYACNSPPLKRGEKKKKEKEERRKKGERQERVEEQGEEIFRKLIINKRQNRRIDESSSTSHRFQLDLDEISPDKPRCFTWNIPRRFALNKLRAIFLLINEAARNQRANRVCIPHLSIRAIRSLCCAILDEGRALPCTVKGAAEFFSIGNFL